MSELDDIFLREFDEHEAEYFMSKNITIAELNAMPDAAYVNGEVIGYLGQIRPPNGKGPSKAVLSEGAQRIGVSIWGGSVSHWEGKRVKFSGKGMQIKEYRGEKGLSVGDKATIEPAVELTQDHADHPDYVSALPVPPSRRVPIQTRPAAQSPHQGQQMPLSGQTIGMSVKAAVDIWLASMNSLRAQFIYDEKSGAEVEKIARSIIAISQRIEQDPNNEAAVPF